jgi:SAM-dependent MidA family methyltransferase
VYADPAPGSVSSLPSPDAAQRRHSDELSKRIGAAIDAAGGCLDFDRYMQMALYEPGLGYYSGGAQKFGAAGDFVTAPELTPLFGRCLAQQVAEIALQLGDYDILEAGAGSGALAVSMLAELDRLGCPPVRYHLLEVSAELRERQQQTLDRAGIDPRRLHWPERLPADGFRGVVIANELLDAMPVQRFRFDTEGPQLRCVEDGGDGFRWATRPAPPLIRQLIESRVPIAARREGYESEINPAAEAWVASVAGLLDAGAMILVDYGFPRHEYYHPDRSGGTLMCHYRHHAHADPLVLAGLQDITAHVEFTAVAEAAHDAGLAVLGYTNQAAFLLGNGLADFAARSDVNDTRAHLEMTAQIKKLTLPSEMGELFKVMVLGKGVDGPLRGFATLDLRNRL